ncbi:MAG: glutaredoxin family protein [Geodermatophilaceae bacterium]
MTLLTRAGCHLCEQAQPVLERICEQADAALSVLDVDADRELRAEYGDRLPVFLIDGWEHGYWRVEEARLRAALDG